uniref:Phytocyanin domain-containing protein n=1 Tax=Rhizophora mucronata TaxID=61149 RepID=A0A2P2PKG5_RHIMU
MSKVIKTFDNRNTTVALTRPGTRYFVCGNRLRCLGGMKLKVKVEGNQTSPPVGAPQAQPQTQGTVKQPSSKSNNPVIPTSAGFVHGGWDSLQMAFLSFVAMTMLVVV